MFRRPHKMTSTMGHGRRMVVAPALVKYPEYPVGSKILKMSNKSEDYLLIHSIRVGSAPVGFSKK